ncbi:hypothetical protein O5D80_006419 [Batrachochytrium dendrobatidis]|nr:hypothetical protein O5D80_006419 [Batrachochytrium dendrobatidis]
MDSLRILLKQELEKLDKTLSQLTVTQHNEPQTFSNAVIGNSSAMNAQESLAHQQQPISLDSTDLLNVQPRMITIAGSISRQATLLAIALKGNDAKEVSSACSALMDFSAELVQLVCNTPVDVGRSLKRHLILAAQSLLCGLVNLQSTDASALEALSQSTYARSDTACLSINSAAGGVWAACNDIANVPPTNAALAVVLLERYDDQLNDAIQECQDLLNGPTDNEDSFGEDNDEGGWNELVVGNSTKAHGYSTADLSSQDMDWVRDVQSMIKTCRLSFKMVMANLSGLARPTAKENQVIDVLVDLALRCVEKADNAVCDINLPLIDCDEDLYVAVDELGSSASVQQCNNHPNMSSTMPR